jgi:hypothetical protein
MNFFQGEVVLAVLFDNENVQSYALQLLARYASLSKMYFIFGNRAEEIHDRLDDLLIESNHIGTPTAFSVESQATAIQEVLDMSSGYRVPIFFIAASDKVDREFVMLSSISSSLAHLATCGPESGGDETVEAR